MTAVTQDKRAMIAVGQQMLWHKVASNYGHIAVCRVTVCKIGKRITIEVPLMGGGTRLASVTPERLHPIPSAVTTGKRDG